MLRVKLRLLYPISWPPRNWYFIFLTHHSKQLISPQTDTNDWLFQIFLLLRHMAVQISQWRSSYCWFKQHSSTLHHHWPQPKCSSKLDRSSMTSLDCSFISISLPSFSALFAALSKQSLQHLLPSSVDDTICGQHCSVLARQGTSGLSLQDSNTPSVICPHLGWDSVLSQLSQNFCMKNLFLWLIISLILLQL